jgi:hypothetical protein
VRFSTRRDQESLRSVSNPLQSSSYLIAELILGDSVSPKFFSEQASLTMKENEASERAIYEAAREAEDSFQKRDPLAFRDLFVANREDDKSPEYDNFNGCRSQFDVVEVLEEELLAHE